LEEIAISKFKSTCLAVLECVRKTRTPILVTRFGSPVAEIIPPSRSPRPSSWLGGMAGTGKILGEVISPASAEEDWDVLRS
jgi:antitoxin (DNA-binding transcriptional repressor) of toxin-antitoxin stability system